jgi:threonine synthase
MKDLAENGSYAVTNDIKKKLSKVFWAGYCDDYFTKETIYKTNQKYGYTVDTHTAVAFKVYEDYVKNSGDNTKTVIASTASPYKFAKSVLSAIGEELCEDEFAVLKMLSDKTKTEIPAPIKNLEKATVRFKNIAEKQDMPEVVLNYLGL